MLLHLPDGINADAVRAPDRPHGRLRTSAAVVDLGPRQRNGQHSDTSRALATAGVLLRPAPPWQRGTNENTNRLLRQYLHRNADLATFTQDELNAVAAKLNHRPRRVLPGPPRPRRSALPSRNRCCLRLPSRGQFLGCDHDEVRAGGLPELDVARVQRRCAGQVPEHVRDGFASNATSLQDI